MSSTKDMVQRLKKAANAVSKASYELGRAASDLYKEGFSFHEMEGLCGIKHRMLRYATQAVDYCDAANLGVEVYANMGVTKMVLLSEHVPPSESVKWVVRASVMTCQELKRALTGSGGNRMTVFEFDDEQHAILRKMLLRHGSNLRGRGLANKEDALIRILLKLERLEDLTPATNKDAA